MTRREFVQQATLGLGVGWTLSCARRLDRAWSAGYADESRARVDGGRLILENGVIAAEWEISSEGSKTGLRMVRVEDRRTKEAIAGPQSAFSLTLHDGTLLEASRLTLIGPARVEALRGDPAAARFSERLPGRQIVATLADREGRLTAVWRAVLRDGSHYVRQELALKAVNADVEVREVTMIALDLPGSQLAGQVKGSPVTAGKWFLGFEHPLSDAAVDGPRVRCWFARRLSLRAGQTAEYSSVIGFASDGQLRRGFLQYLERERAHPYRTLLHYNSWYDLGYFTPFDEMAALDSVRAFGRELCERRGVTLDSFLFDDGWDDYRLWGFNSGFPRGFAQLKEEAARYSAALGVWLSPWGGYGKPREARLQHGRTQGFETNAEGFALSGPVYYRRFHEVCLEMIRAYGVNQLKIDGTGSVGTVVPGSEFGSDFEAAISLIGDLRQAKRDLFVNLTTGTYPSPFWLRYVDSTWRGGSDHSFAGVGSDRQQWITYRDAKTFANVVKRGPLYPLNALMLHGLIFAKHARKLDSDPHDDFEAEIRSYFGSGTELQEMYITHSLLSPRDWDSLAESAKWSRYNMSTLVDTHWVGGDPGKLEVYGWASWSPRKAILTLRNPSDKPQSFDVEVAAVFELPPGSPQSYRARSPWERDRELPPVDLHAGRSRALSLKPFEVITLEAVASTA